ncbi:Glutathione S-transferase T3 [Cardamine amara subsp. amara]|uniref:Glutathione S-transferase T3 n=1 Tax=Cardamine amara subsp. amara TaxID=228776 RepID=A0ABD1BQ44_CARAN
MDSENPYRHSSGFMDILNSQQESHNLEPNPDDNVSPSIELGESEVPLFSTQWSDAPSQGEDRRSRRKWTPTEDFVLISVWLNTSKDPIVGNEQKAEAFWKRIAAYFASSPKLFGLQKREPIHCKQRWGKLNDVVCKFVGCYEAATSLKSSGQNENDVMKLANQIYFNDHKSKFTLEHAWRELRGRTMF